MFFGNQQHDAAEFINFLLDKMNEEMNRVAIQQDIAPPVYFQPKYEVSYSAVTHVQDLINPLANTDQEYEGSKDFFSPTIVRKVASPEDSTNQ